MPNKTGRNDPCPCGSGQKYKRCCLDKDQAAESKAFAAQAAEAAASQAKFNAKMAAARAAFDEQGYAEEEDELTEASNAAVDLVHAGKLDEAEHAARDLLVRFPEVHDGYDRLGMVHEARGEKKLAADCYRKVVEFCLAHSDQYDPHFATRFQQMVEELDPPTPG
ncbi:SEC-C metal-binding domain-containing protein [Methyloceanibacter sp.]|uniref:SEC-C metal-binding domain-containing protein n=1 Tax=Methyloceanibacter sp. TaxID=1965321 RepID=UPI003D6D8D8B